MRLDTSQQMRTDMRLRMAPRMIQSMEILQLPLMALQEKIDQELIENPMLVDLRDGVSPEPESEAESASAESETPPEYEFPDEDWEGASGSSGKSRSALMEESDRRYDAMQNMASRPESLNDYLAHQLSFLDCDDLSRSLAEYIIYNLDDHGFVRGSAHDIARDFGQDVTVKDVNFALSLVQKLDPPGVAARDLRECLLLQLTPDIPDVAIVRRLISDHLDDITQNRLPLIEKRTGLSIETIKKAIEQLRRLNPRPGAGFSESGAQHVLPDLIVELDDEGKYDVRLIDDYTPRLAISRQYQRMLKDKQADTATREFIQKKIQSARWLIESIEQRRNTLLKVAKAIIAHQTEFLDKGPERINPLKMQQIADQVHVHVTTVSRAVDDKWVQTPRGIFPLKRFFGGGTTAADGEEVAWETIKQKLLDVIAKEDKSNPLSDEELVDELGRLGLPVARRTITKYRKALRIPSSRQRKQF